MNPPLLFCDDSDDWVPTTKEHLAAHPASCAQNYDSKPKALDLIAAESQNIYSANVPASIARDELISPEDYLAGELESPVKHEYLAGVVYAMAGAKNRHNQIAINILGSLYNQLRGGKCRPFNSDTKVRIRLPNHLRFYYPDALVTCEPNRPDDSYQDHPIVVVEVISESTRRTDEGEKREGYLALPSLELYLLVESERALAVGFHRAAEGFKRAVYSGRDATIPLPVSDTALLLSDIYEGVDFPGSV